MRGHQIVNLIFERLATMKSAEIVEWQDSKKQAMFLPEDQAAIVFSRYKGVEPHCNFSTTFAKLMVWNVSLPEDFEVDDVLTYLAMANPSFSITGGPYPTGEWEKGRGRRLKEGVFAEYNHVVANFNSNWPFLQLLDELASLAHVVVDEYRDAMLVFWEKTLNPQYSH